MNVSHILVSLFLASSLVAADKPNVILILADDLGYGDIGCYNLESKVPTPHLDRLAKQGMKFTDAHSPAAVCTPTRYSVLTGEMAFRSWFKGVVFTGAGGPCMIGAKQLSLPGMLRQKGYATAAVGKWHVGMTFRDKNGKAINQNGLGAVKRIDYSRSITDAPIHRGFDYFFGTACCPTTDFLYAYIEGDRIPVPPTKMLDKTKLPKHVYSKDNRDGMWAPGFDLEEVDMVFLKKSVDYIDRHVKESSDKPFFLYLATQAVHLPSFPGKQFKGKTNAGPHGDFIFEFDYIVGQLMKTLERHNLTENTIVIVSSDNGPEVAPVLHMRKNYGHDPARPWRGKKRDQYEGGHRVPLIVRWPEQVKAGSTSSQLTSLTDIMATLAAVTEFELQKEDAKDSFNMLPVLKGEAEFPVREYMLQQSLKPTFLSIRKGPWKYLDHRGSGGYPYPKRDNHPAQLYHLGNDPNENVNLYEKHPEIVKELKDKLDQFKKSGRSRP